MFFLYAVGDVIRKREVFGLAFLRDWGVIVPRGDGGIEAHTPFPPHAMFVCRVEYPGCDGQ